MVDFSAIERECGSPAVDGYAHVNATCLETSSTSRLWQRLVDTRELRPEELDCNVEENVSIDGLAVAWGPFHKKNSWEECCEACKKHVPGPQHNGPFK